MKTIRTAAMAALLALPLSSWAQGSQARTRKALLSDIQDMLDFIPDKSQDPVNIGYRGIFQGIQAEARTTKLQALPETGKKFDDKRSEYFNALFRDQHAAFKDDPAAFKDYMLKRYHLAVVLRRLQESKDIKLNGDQMKRLAAWRSQLNEQNVSVPQLNALTTQLGSYRQRADAQGRYWTGEKLALRTDFLPQQHSPEAGHSAPPPAAVGAVAAVVPVSFSLTPVVSSLSDFISSVGKKAKGYAQQVASAIVNSSAARNIDASLTTALVWAESTFSHTAGSLASCIGLGQLSEGVADQYGVRDRTNVADNLKGTTGFLRDLLSHFTTHDERAYVNGLFAQEAAHVRAGANVDQTFKRIWPRIPDGMKNAVAAYNAGKHGVEKYGGWDQLPLPRAKGLMKKEPSAYVHLALDGRVDSAGRPLINRCWDRPDYDPSYCQTMDYVPKVLAYYFTVYVQTTPNSVAAAPTIMAAADRPNLPSGI